MAGENTLEIKKVTPKGQNDQMGGWGAAGYGGGGWGYDPYGYGSYGGYGDPYGGYGGYGGKDGNGILGNS